MHQVELEMQNDELRRNQTQLDESRTRYADLYDFAPVGYLTLDRDGLIVEANLTAARRLGRERALILERPFSFYVHERDRDALCLHLEKVFRTGEPQTCEIRLAPKDAEAFFARLDSMFIEKASGTGFSRTSLSDITSAKSAEEVLQQDRDELKARVAERTAEISAANEQLKHEMQERRQAEIQTQATNALLKLLNEASSRKEYLDAAVEQIRNQTGCCCVGVRMFDERGVIPYESHAGFGEEFPEAESWISRMRDFCVCPRIMAGRIEPVDAPHLTEAGSYFCNDTAELAAGLTEEEKSRFRGTCMKRGFGSFAVIPVLHGGKVLGVIHLADEREGLVPRRRVEFVESLAKLIGAAVYRFNTQARLRYDLETREVVNTLLRFSLEDVSLEELLGRGLDLLLSIPWLSCHSKGSIFLVEDAADMLVMKVQRGLSEERAARCGRVPFGKCVCGRTILHREIQLVPCTDDRHEIPSPSGAHSHYCVPIHFSGKILGLVNLYVAIDHRQDPREIEFLIAVSNTLAGIVQRNRVEEALRRTGEKYRELVENANSMILRLDMEGNITFCNEFVQSFFGYTEQELIGRNCFGTILPATDSYGRDLTAMAREIMKYPERFARQRK